MSIFAKMKSKAQRFSIHLGKNTQKARSTPGASGAMR